MNIIDIPSKCNYNLVAVIFHEDKRQLNIKNHGIDFVGCEIVFAGLTITREDNRNIDSEIRLQTLGLFNGMVVFMLHTPRDNNDHIISIRKAEKHKEKLYWKHFRA